MVQLCKGSGIMELMESMQYINDAVVYWGVLLHAEFSMLCYAN